MSVTSVSFAEDDDKPATSVVVTAADAKKEPPGEVHKLIPGAGLEKPVVGAFVVMRW